MSAATGAPARPRCFPQTGALLTFDYPSQIARHASILVTRFPPRAGTFPQVEPDILGLYSGPTSIAFALYTQRHALPASIKGKTPVEWAKAYLQASQELVARPDVGPKIPSPVDVSHCGLFNEPMGYAVTAAAVYDDPSYLEPLFEAAPRVIADPPSDRQKHRSGRPMDVFDVHYGGRAGYLYYLRFAKATFPSVAKRVDDIIPRVIEAMLVRGPESRYGWRWVLGYFSSISHGWTGILVQILLSDPSAGRAEQCRPWVMRVIQDQLPNGNWGRYLSIPDDDNPDPLKAGDPLVQIGAGGPGVVIGLMAVRGVYEAAGDREMVVGIDNAVDKAQECIWTRGLLTKESSIDHGAAGNALALLDPARQATFMAHSTQERIDDGIADGTIEASDQPGDLQRGLAGRIWAMIALQQGRAGVVPGVNDF